MFYREDNFPWKGRLQAEWESIRDEALAVVGTVPPVSSYKDYPSSQWRKFPLVSCGAFLLDNLKQCPVTDRLLRTIPGIVGAVFSLLEPHGSLPPHNNPIFYGFTRCHLGLRIPPNCTITAQGETRAWEEGKWLFFDDTKTHSVQNDSDSPRVILLVDVKNPDDGLTRLAYCQRQYARFVSLLDAELQFESRKREEDGMYECIPGAQAAAGPLVISDTSQEDSPIPGVATEAVLQSTRALYPEYTASASNCQWVEIEST